MKCFNFFFKQGMYLTAETDNFQFCTKREAEGSNGYSTSRQIVSVQTRVCKAGSFQRDPGEVATAVPKAGRTEVKFGEVSSGNLGQEQEQEMMKVLQDQAVSLDQQGQEHEKQKGTQVNSRQDTGHHHQVQCLTWAFCWACLMLGRAWSPGQGWAVPVTQRNSQGRMAM